MLDGVGPKSLGGGGDVVDVSLFFYYKELLIRVCKTSGYQSRVFIKNKNKINETVTDLIDWTFDDVV